MKVTKKQQREFLREKLSTDRKWALKAMLLVYSNQTQDEQESEHTIIHNGVGFTGVDGKILTSFTKQYHKVGRLTEKQFDVLLKKMPKYWKQVLVSSNEDKLNELIINK